MTDAPTYRRKLAGGADPAPGTPLITADHIGDYRGRIPPTEQAFLELALGSQMRHLGYAPDPPRLRRRAAAEYWAWTLPSNAVRMAAWHALEAVQHRFPRLLGRKPPRAKVVGDAPPAL
jgi:hypothetical protein